MHACREPEFPPVQNGDNPNGPTSRVTEWISDVQKTLAHEVIKWELPSLLWLMHSLCKFDAI